MSPLRIALFASLGLNLFIGGWWVGDIVRRAPVMMPPPMMGGVAEPSAAIVPTLKAIDTILRNGTLERITLLETLRDTASAEPYDAAAVRALLDSMLDLRQRVDAERWSVVAEALPKLNEADRVALAGYIFSPYPGPGGNMAPNLGPPNLGMFLGQMPPPPPPALQ